MTKVASPLLYISQLWNIGDSECVVEEVALVIRRIVEKCNIAIHASCWECCVKCRTIVIIRFRECRECNEGPREEEKAQGGIGRQWGNCEINMLCITIPLLHQLR
ncbi:uncharacterized protein LOC114941295 [Nylanderia fulva]|uniref:uncharacterized protein LOC114941295 n=1 Tax=Nylanderia fulva TaxID=613905 RepID=UPI0010FB75EC|nr:uncharacterized protein LOC114941295 [Nylanderia fulva]